MVKACFAFAVVLVLLNARLGAIAQPMAKAELPDDPRNQICQLIEASAKANALPIDFFARLIWQESRFQPDEIGPVTRNGQHAQGIAQFMPGTAAERQLLEPFNPAEALPKSGEFLAELRAEFGNLGLAAAAYNAGPQRVRDLMASLERTPNRIMAQWQGRKFPSWCKGLQHPNIEECGPFPLMDPAIKTTNFLLPRSHVHLARASSR